MEDEACEAADRFVGGGEDRPGEHLAYPEAHETVVGRGKRRGRVAGTEGAFLGDVIAVASARSKEVQA